MATYFGGEVGDCESAAPIVDKTGLGAVWINTQEKMSRPVERTARTHPERKVSSRDWKSNYGEIKECKHHRGRDVLMID